jgi:hypothetical protein
MCYKQINTSPVDGHTEQRSIEECGTGFDLSNPCSIRCCSWIENNLVAGYFVFCYVYVAYKGGSACSQVADDEEGGKIMPMQILRKDVLNLEEGWSWPII